MSKYKTEILKITALLSFSLTDF